MTASDPQTISLEGASILLIEDEAFLAMDIEENLHEAGASVVGPVGNLQEAIELARCSQGLAGAILDINLQGREAFPVADLLTARQVPFIFHTGHGVAEELARTYPKAGICVKPVVPAKLLAALSHMIGAQG